MDAEPAGGRSYADAPSAWQRGRSLVREEGLRATVVRLATYPNAPWNRYLWAAVVRVGRRLSGPSTFEGPDGPLRYGPALGERTIEVPIARAFVEERRSSGPVLEVGNVLAHHAPFPHPVVDRYERAEGVENVDVVAYRPAERFPSILSVSTLEHVGFDETPRVPGKFRAALDHLRTECLAPDGAMLVTVPLGQNPEVDRYVLDERAPEAEVRIYRRIASPWNRWAPVGPPDWPTAAAVPRYSYVRHRLSYTAILRFGGRQERLGSSSR